MIKKHIETVNHSRAIGRGISRTVANSTSGISVGISKCQMFDDRKSESYGGSPDAALSYYLRINAMAAELLDLDALAKSLRLTRYEGEDNDGLASRCHYQIHHLIREHALQVGAERILDLIALHDFVHRLAP